MKKLLLIAAMLLMCCITRAQAQAGKRTNRTNSHLQRWVCRDPRTLLRQEGNYTPLYGTHPESRTRLTPETQRKVQAQGPWTVKTVTHWGQDFQHIWNDSETTEKCNGVLSTKSGVFVDKTCCGRVTLSKMAFPCVKTPLLLTARQSRVQKPVFYSRSWPKWRSRVQKPVFYSRPDNPVCKKPTFTHGLR